MKKSLLFGAIVALAMGFSSPADAILFDTQGLAGAGQVINVDTFDWDPDSALGVGAVRAIQAGAGSTFDLLAHASLGNFQAGGSNILGTGLNSSFEITFVGGFEERVVLSTGGLPGSALFGLSPGTPNFFEMWYDTNLDADSNLDGEGVPSAGTGFNNGTLIMSGNIYSANGSFGAFGIGTVFDAYNADSLPGIDSVIGSGGSSIGVVVNPTFYDTDFFLGTTNLTQFLLAFNTSQIVPFAQVDPATIFTGLPGGGAPGVIPLLGSVNGLTGPDFQFQADANMSLTTAVVPEPSTIILLGAGLLGLGGLGIARRRKGKDF